MHHTQPTVRTGAPTPGLTTLFPVAAGPHGMQVACMTAAAAPLVFTEPAAFAGLRETDRPAYYRLRALNTLALLQAGRDHYNDASLRHGSDCRVPLFITHALLAMQVQADDLIALHEQFGGHDGPALRAILQQVSL